MKFFHQIFSIIIAITIANPLCCCAFGSTNQDPTAPTQKSCCCSTQSTENSDENTPSEDSHNCPCADTQSNVSHQKQDIAPLIPTDFTSLPQTNLPTDLPPHLTELHIAPRSYIPPPKRLIKLYQRFLI